MIRSIPGYGWIPDIPDFRDYLYAATASQLPDLVDLRTTPAGVSDQHSLGLAVAQAVSHFLGASSYTTCMPDVYNQLAVGSCTGNAAAGMVQYVRRLEGLPDFTPSRLFIYYNERLIEGTVDSDAGAMIRDALKVIAQYGVCSEDTWRYDVTQFAVKPSDVSYAEALQHEATVYSRVLQSPAQMMGCLAEGYPFIGGIAVFESFESPVVARTGVVPMPSASEAMIGGHAIMFCGYDAQARTYLVRNSWGPAWGQGGYFTLPFEYAHNPQLCDDLWTLRVVA